MNILTMFLKSFCFCFHSEVTVACQTDLLGEDLVRMEKAIADYQTDIAELKHKTVCEESLKHDEHKLKFYTGKSNYHICCNH